MKIFGVFLVFAFMLHFVSIEAHNPPKQLLFEESAYLNSDSISIDENGMYVYLADEWVKANTVRCDEQGLYVTAEDVEQYGSRVSPQPEKWRCPYCHRWWLIGEKCQYEGCPTNQWKKEK